MASRPETKWQKKILDIIEREGGIGYKNEAKFISGYPDLNVAKPGYIPTLIEVKMNKMELDILQERIYKKLVAGGFRYIAICILMEDKDVWAVRFDPIRRFEICRAEFNKVTSVIW